MRSLTRSKARPEQNFSSPLARKDSVGTGGLAGDSAMRRRVWRGGTVSAVGFGAMSFGGFYGPTSEADSMRTLARALELGVDFWDTADVYGDGLCERVIGKFLAEDKSRRGRVRFATKFAIRRRDDGSRFFDNSAAHMREALDGSRKRLGVDHIDLYYVHRLDKSIPIEDTVGELARFVKEGAIGAIGLSEVAPDPLWRAQDVHPIAAVQSEYSLWTRGPELGLIQACAELSALLVAFSPLGRGWLGGLLQNAETFGDRDFRHANPRFQGVNWRRNRDRLDAFLALARTWELKPATLALAWTLAKAPHIVPIPGTRTAAHLEDCAAAAEIDLTDAQLAAIERALPVGFAAGERYSEQQWVGIQKY
jgi:aryl-alcohol dehydrogenase-like predicted oxidoreductase